MHTSWSINQSGPEYHLFPSLSSIRLSARRLRVHQQRISSAALLFPLEFWRTFVDSTAGDHRSEGQFVRFDTMRNSCKAVVLSASLAQLGVLSALHAMIFRCAETGRIFLGSQSNYERSRATKKGTSTRVSIVTGDFPMPQVLRPRNTVTYQIWVCPRFPRCCGYCCHKLSIPADRSRSS
jgi:hypothetical protein